jgi:hypothetical protein
MDDNSRTLDVYVIVTTAPGNLTANALEYYGTFAIEPDTDTTLLEGKALAKVALRLSEIDKLDGAIVTEVRTWKRHPAMLVPMNDWWTNIRHPHQYLVSFLPKE